MKQMLNLKTIKYMAILFLCGSPIVSCGGSMEEESKHYEQFSEVPDAEWLKLSSKSFFFGHQSVGKNILEGIEDISLKKPGIQIKIVETDKKADIEKGVLAHYRVGANLNPVKKIEDFAALMNNGIGNKADYAFVKLCYLDIDKNTNVESLFDTYVKILSELQKKYPETTFIHFTSPLTVSRISWKTKIKKSLGMGDLWELNDNIKRNQFNTLLRNKYKGKEPVFDIAALESTLPDGRQFQFEMGGVQYQYMAPDYTPDGGHLNKNGQQRIAEQLLLMLLQLK